MRVLLDGYWLSGGPPSGRNVVRGLIHGWRSAAPSDELLVVGRPGPAAQLADSGLIEAQSRLRPHALFAAAPTNGRFRADLTLTQNFTRVHAAGKRAVFIHDVIYLEHPEWFTRAERAYLSPILPLARGADLIFTSSRAEARRISRFAPHLKDRVRPVGLALPTTMREGPVHVPRGVRPERLFVLSIGRFNVRKNLARLVEAFDESSAGEGYDLVIAGPTDGVPPDITRRRESWLRLIGPVSDAELRWLYRRSSLMVFPSLDEGFGLPILEAQEYNLPFIASDIPAFRELGGASAYFDPRDVTEIARAIRESVDLHDERVVDAGGRRTVTWEDVVGKIRTEVSLLTGR